MFLRLSLVWFLMIAPLCLSARGGDWSRFRGPNGTGVATALDLPHQWQESDYAWQVQLPGLGHGSPVVHNGQVYVTSGESDSAEVHLDAYDAASGNLKWRRTFATSGYPMHTYNCYASTTPATDDQRVYFSYATPDQVVLVALTHEGEEVWQRELGGFSSQHGFGVSPVVLGEVVCLQGDTAEEGYVVGLDATTGETRWIAQRSAGKESYSTPAVIEWEGGLQALVVGSQSAGITAIDPQSGDKLWQTGELPARTVASPLVAENLIVIACGSGGGGHRLVAVRANSASEYQPAYTLTQNVPYVPTPIVVGDLMFLWHDRGTVTCVELATGEEVWTKRVGGKFFGSPIAIGDRLLAMSMSGEAVMLAASRDYQLLGRTDLGEPSQATPAVADGRLFLRTESKLMCLQE